MNKYPKILIGLDFDGVLHPNTCHRFENKEIFINFLNKLIEQTNAKVDIVITSNWRQSNMLETIANKFLPELASYIIGATDTMKEGRAVEFLSFVENINEEKKYDFYFCLDDNNYLFNGYEEILYLVDSNVGFTKEDGEKIIKKISYNFKKFVDNDLITYKNRF